MKLTLRVAFISLTSFFTIAYAVTPAFAVSLAECITNSQDANNIIRSAPCGIYGIVNTRQENAVGATLDVTVQYMVHVPVGEPKAVVMLFAGGNGDTGIQGNDATGEVTHAGNNFLVRSAQLFSEDGFLAVTIDRPSTTVGLSNADFDLYRVSPRHAHDIAAVLSEVNALFGTAQLDLFLAGTSRGAISVVAQNMLGIGSMLSSAVTSPSGNNLWVGSTSTQPRLVPEFVDVPAQVLAHEGDGCFVSTPANSAILHSDLIDAGASSVFNQLNGGFIVDPDPCQAKTLHGFLGIENAAVDTITDRMNGILAVNDKLHPGNHKPRARNARFRTHGGVPILINLAALTSDPDGNFLFHSLPHNASSRGAKLLKFGPFVLYIPPASLSNVLDGFVYTAADGKGGKSIGIVAVKIN